jgi:hypothetical protein
VVISGIRGVIATVSIYCLAGLLSTLVAQAPFLLAAKDWSMPPPHPFTSRNVILSGGLPLLVGVLIGIYFCGHRRAIQNGLRPLLGVLVLLIAFAPIRHRWVWGDDVSATIEITGFPIYSWLTNAIGELVGDSLVALLPVLMVGLACKLMVARWHWKIVWIGVVILVVTDWMTDEILLILLRYNWFPPIVTQSLKYGAWVGVLAGTAGVWIFWSTTAPEQDRQALSLRP